MGDRAWLGARPDVLQLRNMTYDKGRIRDQLEKRLESLTDTNLGFLSEVHLDSTEEPQRACTSAEQQKASESRPQGTRRKTEARSTSLPTTCYCLSQEPGITLREVNVFPTELLLSH